MHFLSKTSPLFLFLLLASCATENAGVHPYSPAAASLDAPAFRSTPITIADPEQGLNAALQALQAGNHEAALSAARVLAEQHPRTPWYKRALFLIEQALIGMDRTDEADAAMLRVKSEYPEMAGYAVSLLADYHYAGRRYTRAAALYQHLEEQYADGSLGTRAAYRRSRALLESYAYGPAAELLEIFLKENARSEHAPDAALSLGRAYLYDLKTDQAVRAYRRVWVQFPGTVSEKEAHAALLMLSASGIAVPEWTGDEWFERGRNLYRAAQYDKAAEAFGKSVELDPRSPQRPEALFRVGIAQYHCGRRTEAAAALEKLKAEYPKDERVPEALYWIGRAYSRLGESGKAVAAFRKIVKSYPRSEWADDALFLIGNVYRDGNDMARAGTFYAQLASDHPDSRFADSGIWWIAWSHYRAGEFRMAEQKLKELVGRYPRSFLVHQGRYWLGRIAEKTGSPEKAAVEYNRVLKRGMYTYYGYLAADRLAALNMPITEVNPGSALEVSEADCGEECPPESFSTPETDDGPPVWTEETRRLLAADPSFRTILELMHLNLKKEAAAELWQLQEELPRRRGAMIGLAKAFFEMEDYYRSLILVLRSYERYLESEDRNLPADLWLLAYPQGYWEAVLSYARKYGQDPYFIAAIIRQESRFQTDALSPAGARGVMQVMPATGEWIARNIRMEGFERSRLFESDTAINLGTWYVSHLMKRFKGDPLLVAAAYNAGPEAVSGWVGRNGSSLERDEFVEAIPYAETRGYVKKILRNYAEYRRLYGKENRAMEAFVGPAAAHPVVNDDIVRTP